MCLITREAFHRRVRVGLPCCKSGGQLAKQPLQPISGNRVQATDTMVIFVRAWIAAATALVVCAFGCRQVDTLGPGNASLSLDRPQSLPLLAPRVSSAQVVEVCRFPDEPGESRSTAPNEIVGETAPIDCNFSEGMGTMERLSCGECEPLPPSFGGAAKGLAELADAIEPVNPSAGRPLQPDEVEEVDPKARFGEILTATRDNVFHDYSNYYTRRTLGEFIVILAPAAVFANSDFDADVGTWYQTHVRSVDTNRTSNFIRPLGNGYYTIPFYVSAKLLGEYFDDQPGMALLGEFGDRTTRALLVGGPPFLALQYLTGGGRPSEYADESYWRPFRGSHGASGHAFMGAVPFLTLAGMTDDPLAKCVFYACSPWTGITRINDNVHYLSQVWLGWWMAYLATDAVYKTEKEKGPVVLTPICTPEMTGVGLIYQH